MEPKRKARNLVNAKTSTGVYIGLDRRVGPKDRRIFQQQPMQSHASAWLIKVGPFFRRITKGKEEYSANQRTGRPDRRE